jgi:hypothetical protein
MKISKENLKRLAVVQETLKKRGDEQSIDELAEHCLRFGIFELERFANEYLLNPHIDSIGG